MTSDKDGEIMYEVDHKRLEKDFTYHAPNSEQSARYNAIRSAAKLMGELLMSSCPLSRELSVALTKLDETVMFANAAIARNES